MKGKNETTEHKKIKDIFEGELKKFSAVTVKEYPESGHELDVFSVDVEGISVLIEVIWAYKPAHFHKDINILLSKPADVKIVAANPKIIANDNLKREYEKTRLSQTAQNIVMSEMLNGKKILRDRKYVENYVRTIIESCIQAARNLRSKDKDRLHEHYSNIREKTLVPLLEYGKRGANFSVGPEPFDDLRYFYKPTSGIDHFYLEVLDQHLQKDLPNGAISYKELERFSAEHEAAVRKLLTEIKDKVRKRISTIATVVEDFPTIPNTIYLDAIMQILHNRWHSIRHLLSLGKNIEEAIRETESITEVYQKQHDETTGLLKLGENTVAILDSQQVSDLEHVMNRLIKDKMILTRMKSLQVARDKLAEQQKQIDSKLSTLLHEIEDKQYNTRADCCRRVLGRV